jgi:hypothetical protein
MAKQPTAFNRSPPRLKQQPTILVLCEDKKSGKQYLEDAANFFRARAQVEFFHCGHTDPKGIVEHALERQRNFDNIFCVIDRDTHPSFDEAVALAKSSAKITLIISNPCFEFWLILHFRFTSKPYAVAGKLSPGDLVLRDLKACAGMQDYDKGDGRNIFKQLNERQLLISARKNAKKVLLQAIECKQMNPSTTVHELLTFFEELSGNT